MFEVVPRVIEAKQAGIRVYPCHTNRASSIGHSCEKYLVYERTRWQERKLPDINLQFIFDLGKNIEEIAIAQLKEAGFVILEQNRYFDLPKERITGHIDLKLKNKGTGEVAPCEIKGLEHHTWETINTEEDMFQSKKPWIKKYPAQLQSYLYMSEYNEGLFYLVSKLIGKPKEIWTTLNYEYVDFILRKAERINEYIDNQITPPPIPWDPQVCERCDFLHLCMPDRKAGEGIDLMDDPELLDKIDRWYELKDGVTEYNALDRDIKPKIHGKTEVLLGDKYLISGQWVEPKGKKRYWKPNISRVD